MRVDDAGPYDVRIRFVAGAEIARARLRVGDATWEMDVSEGAGDVTFQGLEFPLGDVRLLAELADGLGVTGAYQIVVTRN